MNQHRVNTVLSESPPAASIQPLGLCSWLERMIADTGDSRGTGAGSLRHTDCPRTWQEKEAGLLALRLLS